MEPPLFRNGIKFLKPKEIFFGLMNVKRNEGRFISFYDHTRVGESE